MNTNDEGPFSAVLTEAAGGSFPTLASLCWGVARILPVSGVSVTLMGPGPVQGVVSALEGQARSVQDLEFTLGEGPGVDAHTGRLPVAIDDLSLADRRWPLFAPSARALGVRSIYSLPLQSGPMTMGVLTLCSELRAALTADQYEDALLVADLVGELVLAMQAKSASEHLASPLDAGDLRAVVHQATGMASAQIGCTIDEALVRLRGHAFSSDQPIDHLAGAVVSGDFRFNPAPTE